MVGKGESIPDPDSGPCDRRFSRASAAFTAPSLPSLRTSSSKVASPRTADGSGDTPFLETGLLPSMVIGISGNARGAPSASAGSARPARGATA